MNKYIAIIPARKGSKGIKNKNLAVIKGKRMIDYTIEAARKTREITKVAVTTDIDKIIKPDTKKIVYIRRPKKIASDTATTESAIIHSLNYLNKKNILTKNVVLLQPTSPFRDSSEISKSIKLFEKKKYNSLFSGYEDKILLWKKNKKNIEPINYKIQKRKRKQDSSALIIENGAIFIFNYKMYLKKKVRLFGKIGCYIMSKKKSVEIDNKFDLILAKKI